MNEQYSNSDFVERTDRNMNSPIENSDPLADKAPWDAAFTHETPMGGTFAAVGPMNEPPTNEFSMDETPVHEIPMEETGAVVEPIDEMIVHEVPMVKTMTHEAPLGMNVEASAALVDREESERFRARWNEIQGKFVDEPRSAVQQADALVTEVIAKITQKFDNELSSLESQWNQVNDVSTEDFRKALQRYRSFFNRLVV